MNKKITSLLSLLGLSLSCSFAQLITVPAGNPAGSGATNITHRKPLGSYYGFERSAIIYKASEINMQGNITSLGFYCDSLTSALAASTPVKIYLKEIMDTAFTAVSTVSTEKAGATLVYSGNLLSSQLSMNAYTTFNLSNPFNYVGANLEVIVETDAGGSGNEGSLDKGFRYFSTGTANRFQYWQSDNTAPSGTGTFNQYRPNIQLNLSAPTPCTNPPTAGLLIATDSSVCEGSTVTFSLQGNTTGAGQQYNWVSSANGINWTMLPNPNVFSNATLTVDSAIYVRCIVVCGSGIDSSSQVHLTMAPFYNCYCHDDLGGYCAGDAIDSVAIQGTTLNNANTDCADNAGPNYSVYPASGNTTATLSAGQTDTLFVTLTGSDIVSMWIDYDQSGTFDTNEWVQVCTTATAGVPVSKTFTVPATALNGLTGMRIRSRYAGNTNDSTSACASFGSGETEDYVVTISGGGTSLVKTLTEKNTTLLLYPNPSEGLVNIFIDGLNNSTGSYTVYTMSGQAITAGEITGNTVKALDMRAYGKGVYFIRYINEGEQLIKKIVIR